VCFLFFFFQAEDGIRVFHVTGVQTCALPILLPDCSITCRCCCCASLRPLSRSRSSVPMMPFSGVRISWLITARNSLRALSASLRSEERRVGKECRACWSKSESIEDQYRRKVE